MKKKQFLWMLFAILVCGFTAMTMASCGDDGDDETPVKPVNPNDNTQQTQPADDKEEEKEKEDPGTPLTLEAIQAGEISFTNYAKNSVTYRVNGGKKINISSNSKKAISVKKGDKVAFYGDNNLYTDMESYENTEFSWHYTRYSHFDCSSDCYIYGNIMSLISSNDFSNTTKLTEKFTFYRLFTNNKHIKNHPEKKLELTATELSWGCYMNMFVACDGLTETPVLYATTLAENCYANMFSNCKGLKKVTNMPAKTLAIQCYDHMFNMCESLTEVPDFVATTLDRECCYSMFEYCTSLEKAPALPATTLAESCYSSMFEHCTSLKKAPELPAEVLADDCYGAMFRDCTSLEKAPELPATKIINMCYRYMFSNCKKLSKVTCLATNPSWDHIKGWLEGVSSTGTFTKAKDIKWPTGGIPSGWTVVEK